MKKRMMAALAAFLLVATALTGCGAKNNETEDIYVNEKVEAFVEEQRAAVEQEDFSMGGQIDATITAEGDAVVFTYQYLGELDAASLEELTEIWAVQLDPENEEIQTSLAELREKTTPEAYMVVRFLSVDGETLYSAELK